MKIETGIYTDAIRLEVDRISNASQDKSDVYRTISPPIRAWAVFSSLVPGAAPSPRQASVQGEKNMRFNSGRATRWRHSGMA
ncbi:MAG: hypothetical protein ABWY05_08575 [Noviherbaspirillum sp.]